MNTELQAYTDALSRYIDPMPGLQIKHIRVLLLELSTRDFATRLGVSRQTVARWESGASVCHTFFARLVWMHANNLAPTPSWDWKKASEDEQYKTWLTDFEPVATKEKITHIRQMLLDDMTQDEMAAALGVHQQTVSRWERGATPCEGPYAQMVWLLANRPDIFTEFELRNPYPLDASQFSAPVALTPVASNTPESTDLFGGFK